MEPACRDLTERDLAGGLRLCRAAGWNQREEDWRALVEPPSVFRVATLGNTVVGTAGAVVYGRELAWVCMVLVDPEARGRGLGTALVEQVLERVGGAGAVGLDATPSGEPVYARLGFAPTQGLTRLKREPSLAGRESARRAGPPGTPRRLTERDLPRLLAWDREVFGADRSRLLRRLLAWAPGHAFVLEDAGAPAGYCLGRPGHHAAQVGPVVAVGPGAARALVSACLDATPDLPLLLDAPSRGGWAGELQALGFHEQRPFTRMYRPCPRVPGRTEHLFGIVGPEFG